MSALRGGGSFMSEVPLNPRGVKAKAMIEAFAINT
jgi:hypothetical protein